MFLTRGFHGGQDLELCEIALKQIFQNIKSNIYSTSQEAGRNHQTHSRLLLVRIFSHNPVRTQINQNTHIQHSYTIIELDIFLKKLFRKILRRKIYQQCRPGSIQAYRHEWPPENGRDKNGTLRVKIRVKITVE